LLNKGEIAADILFATRFNSEMSLKKRYLNGKNNACTRLRCIFA